MKEQFIFLLLSAALLAVYSCNNDIEASGEIITQEIDIDSYDGISVSLAADVYIVQDGNERLEIETHENLFDVIRTENRDGELRIFSDDNISNIRTLNIYLQADDLTKIKLSGSGNVFIYDCLISPRLEAELSGSGVINLCGIIDAFSTRISGSGTININSVTSNTMGAETTGSGTINASGTARTADLRVTGSGDIKGFNLSSEVASAIISGSGDIELTVSEALNATISGSGNIRYKGEAQVNSNVTGSGSVSKVD